MDAAVMPATMPPQYLYRIPEAMILLAMSRSAIYEQIRAGRLHMVKQGRSTRIPAIAIQAYVKLLMTESEGDNLGQTA
jgi:excisionase family DNA binding protein